MADCSVQFGGNVWRPINNGAVHNKVNLTLLVQAFVDARHADEEESGASEVYLRRVHALVMFGVTIMGLLVIAFLLFAILYKNERMQRLLCRKQGDGSDPNVEVYDIHVQVMNKWKLLADEAEGEARLQKYRRDRKPSIWGVLSPFNASSSEQLANPIRVNPILEEEGDVTSDFSKAHRDDGKPPETGVHFQLDPDVKICAD